MKNKTLFHRTVYVETFAHQSSLTSLSVQDDTIIGELAKERSSQFKPTSRRTQALVEKLFCQGSYAEAYDKYGLLNHITVLGHEVNLAADERALISKRSAKVSHFPVSNSCLSSRLFPVRKLFDARIKFGLGTDVK